MRCFENHTVVSFDAIRNSKETLVIHKPIFCDIHPGESLVYYCNPCEESVCQECVVRLHKTTPTHHCERLTEVEDSLRSQLKRLAKMAANRADECQRVTEHFDDSLTELQHQREEAQSSIRESYETYKAALKKARDRALEQMNHLHSERELKVMDLYNSTNNAVLKMEDACKFTTRLLKHGDGTEVAMLKKAVAAQIMNLVKDIPKLDVKFSFKFETNIEKFENIIHENFGKLKTESSSNETRDSGIVGSVSLTSSPPAPLPTSMQSSFEEFALTPTSPLVTPSFQQLSSIAEYNLQQLASLQKDGPPAHTPAPNALILSELLTDDISSTHMLNNLQALAKLGLNTGNNFFR